MVSMWQSRQVNPYVIKVFIVQILNGYMVVLAISIDSAIAAEILSYERLLVWHSMKSPCIRPGRAVQ